MIFKFISGVNAQDRINAMSNKKNDINVYVGFFDLNANFERNIVQSVKSYSNLRFGFGYAMFLVAGEGYYVNGTFVQLFGAKNSHLELNAGLKFMLTNSIADATFSDQVLPDIFAGYRFEKPTGGIIFRVGLNYPTLLNIGVGYKF